MEVPYRQPRRREIRDGYDCPSCGAKKRFMCFDLKKGKPRRQESNHHERENRWFDDHQDGVGRH